MAKESKVYIFHRGKLWYQITLKDDLDAITNAKYNPGTTKVTDSKGKIIWEPPLGEGIKK